MDIYLQYPQNEANEDIRRKKHPYDCFMVSNILLIMADFLMPEVIIVFILIIYSPYFFKRIL